jgi:hypothetical protein
MILFCHVILEYFAMLCTFGVFLFFIMPSGHIILSDLHDATVRYVYKCAPTIEIHSFETRVSSSLRLKWAQLLHSIKNIVVFINQPKKQGK